MDQNSNNQMPIMSTTPNVSPNPMGSPVAPKNHHVKLIIVLAIALVVVGGLTSFAGYAKVFSSAETVIKDSLKAIYEKKTMHSEISIKGSYTSPSQKTQTIEFNMAGNVDNTNKESPKFSTTISLDGMNMNGSAEFRLIDDVLYGMINKVPITYDAYILKYLGKWYHISKKEIEDISKSYTNASSTNIVDENKKYLSEEYVNSLFNKYKLFKDIKLKGLSSDNGVYVKRYSMVFDKVALAGIYMDIFKKDSKIKIDAQNEAYYKDSLNKMLDSVSIDPILLDIGMFDNLIRNIQLNINLLPDKDGKYQANININISYSDFDKPVDIQIPEGSQSLADIIKNSISEAREKGKDAQIESSINNIRMAAELYYNKNNNSYSGLCKTNNADVSREFDFVKTVGGNITCFAKSNAYSVSSTLNNGKYWCVDSTGEEITINKPQTSYSCK